MTDEPCTEINCSAQMHPASEGHIDGPGELERLRAEVEDLRAALLASPASIPVSSPRTLPQVLGMTADDEAAMQASLSESFAAIRAAERRAATSPPVVLGAANDDCPHAAPFRYCDGCAVSPCPIGLD